MAGTAELTAGEVMDQSASLMNDTAKTVYTYVAQIPYLRMALDQLQMEYELNNIPVTNKETSTPITVAAGINRITPPTDATVGIPHYSSDLVEIQQVWERTSGSSDGYIPLTRKDFLPHVFDAIANNTLQYWTWQDQIIYFHPLGALSARQIKLDYIKALFITVDDEDTELNVINAKNYLVFQTAGLCSEFIGANETRAQSLYVKAVEAMDKALGISTKGKQAITTRRRPFRAGYRSRGV